MHRMEKARKLTALGVACFLIVTVAFLLLGTTSPATAAEQPDGARQPGRVGGVIDRNIQADAVLLFNPYTLRLEGDGNAGPARKRTLSRDTFGALPGNLLLGPPTPRIPRRLVFTSPVRPPW